MFWLKTKKLSPPKITNSNIFDNTLTSKINSVEQILSNKKYQINDFYPNIYTLYQEIENLDCPEKFRCFLTKRIMSNPYQDLLGNNYELKTIQNWFDLYPNIRLDIVSLKPNIKLKKEIKNHKNKIIYNIQDKKNSAIINLLNDIHQVNSFIYQKNGDLSNIDTIYDMLISNLVLNKIFPNDILFVIMNFTINNIYITPILDIFIKSTLLLLINNIIMDFQKFLHIIVKDIIYYKQGETIILKIKKYLKNRLS